ncbi:UpxY family transcription antiterminator [Anaerorudis cellulosivorans]|jgi:transcription antitermination factor NusG|uniref:UpxY family transcription antiterminator n=1 Tax=Anaerorudis cellulosivorans TaxID=3397862 RepID=UPI00221E9D93|nr:UpxY family transcription antiterminator [Seramator thermalis]MCW1734234.1 UpxY family transcription antiterminator [Seramator thermalis]
MDKALKWYALYTRSRFEKKAAERLTEQGIEAYVPLQRVMRQWSDRRKLVLEPAIRSYVFVRINHLHYYNVLNTPGIVRYVFFDGKPAVVRDEEIDTLKRVMDAELEWNACPTTCSPARGCASSKGPSRALKANWYSTWASRR